jgi:hypothetical protein
VLEDLKIYISHWPGYVEQSMLRHTLETMRVRRRLDALHGDLVGSCSSILADEREHPRVTPIQASGTGFPIYLIHDVRGDIDCYRGLASALGPDQPFYALRSFASDLHDLQSIEKMATSYLTDLRAFEPTGPTFSAGFLLVGLLPMRWRGSLRKWAKRLFLS